jgi:multicomponent Na+:H+ antiporter subunit E
MWVSKFKLWLVLFVLWFFIQASFTWTHIISGFIVSFLVMLVSYDVLHDNKGKHFKSIGFFRLVGYLGMLFVEIFKSAYVFSINVFKRDFVPVVFKISLEHLSPLSLAIVANSITLTPGTISIEMVNQVIYVMVLADPKTPQSELERPIREKFEKLLHVED